MANYYHQKPFCSSCPYYNIIHEGCLGNQGSLYVSYIINGNKNKPVMCYKKHTQLKGLNVCNHGE